MHRILVVDDEQGIARFVSRALTAEGHQVDTAGGGRAAIDRIGSTGYDLLILDLLMPDVDGESVLCELAARRRLPPTIVLTAVADVDAKVRCLEMGAEDYLVKPFALAELRARVHARLRDDESGPVPATPPAPLRLDVTRRRLVVHGRPIPLSAREFLLMRHLMQRGGEVCSREELLAEVWGYSFDPGSNVVDVYISRLRAKVRVPLIETIRSVGYRFVAA